MGIQTANQKAWSAINANRSIIKEDETQEELEALHQSIAFYLDVAAREAAEAEREACANVAEYWTAERVIPMDCGPVTFTVTGRPIAEVIRARGGVANGA